MNTLWLNILATVGVLLALIGLVGAVFGLPLVWIELPHDTDEEEGE